MMQCSFFILKLCPVLARFGSTFFLILLGDEHGNTLLEHTRSVSFKFALCSHIAPLQVYWLRLSGALVATSTTKDFAGRVELAEPFPVRTLRIPGPFVAPPQGLPMNLVR